MIDHILTDQEWALLIELLTNESQRLSVEIRRSAPIQEAHETLRSRQRTVDRLIERLHEYQSGDLKVGN